MSHPWQSQSLNHWQVQDINYIQDSKTIWQINLDILTVLSTCWNTHLLAQLQTRPLNQAEWSHCNINVDTELTLRCRFSSVSFIISAWSLLHSSTSFLVSVSLSETLCGFGMGPSCLDVFSTGADLLASISFYKYQEWFENFTYLEKNYPQLKSDTMKLPI